MSFAEERDRIYGFLTPRLKEAFPTLVIQYDEPKLKRNTLSIKMYFRRELGSLAGIATDLTRLQGSMYIQCFTPADEYEEHLALTAKCLELLKEFGKTGRTKLINHQVVDLGVEEESSLNFSTVRADFILDTVS